MFEYILIGLVAFIALFFILSYNSLVTLRNRINNAWSQIDVQLKKRYDLIPNLVNTVKGYAKHEKSVFENVTKARTAAMSAGDVKTQAKAENMLTGTLKTLFAVAENYPTLRASENFMMLQEELSGVEGKIAYARQFYNDQALRYNNKAQKFPTNMIANAFGFKARDYFEMEEAERKPVKVEF
ncbi:MAG: LemA family protein [archaeon]